MIITVDGLAASGKGTLSKMLGEKLRLPVLDTGAMWRILAYQLAALGYTPDVGRDELEDAARETLGNGLSLGLQDSDKIRTEEIGNFASVISGFPFLREEMDHKQRDWLIYNDGGILDGRETGVSIAPHADHKFFLMADPAIRASRRAAQLGIQVAGRIQQRDGATRLNAIHASIVERDKREMYRAVCPVRPATDALIIDTSYTSARATLETAIMKIEGREAWEKLRLLTGRL